MKGFVVCIFVFVVVVLIDVFCLVVLVLNIFVVVVVGIVVNNVGPRNLPLESGTKSGQ